MPTFQFKAYTSQGRIESGELDAPSMDAALSLLNARQLLPYETRETKGSAGVNRQLSWPGQRKTLPPREYATFIRELAVLLQADLPVDQCLKLLAGQQKSPAMRAFSDNVLVGVTAGSTLSAALEKFSFRTPPVVPNLVRAGEARGNLASTLTDIARYLETSVEIRAKIRSALTYPLVLAVVALATLSIIIGGLVPTLLPLFAENGAQAPLVLRLADGATRFSAANWPACLAALAFAFVSVRLLLQTPSARRILDRASLGLPMFGPLTRDANTAVLARTLGTLLRNGVPLVTALQISSDAITNGEISSSLRAATEDVKAGASLSKALRPKGILADLALRFIEVGEESSRLDQMLLHLAELTETETQRRIDRAMTLLGPAMTIVIGAVIGTLVLSVMQAVLSVNALALR